MSTQPERIRCHRCGSDRLALVETVEEIHAMDDGVVLVDGVLYGVGEGYSVAGEIISTRLHCRSCDHDWRPRRAVGGSYDHLIADQGR